MSTTDAGSSTLDRMVERIHATGLVRYSEGKIALGVCRGIAARLNIDPVLVRVAFVVALIASGGIAIIVYLLGAILIPDEEGKIVLVRAVRASEGPAIALVAITILLGVGELIGLVAQREGNKVLAFAAIALVGWLLYKRRAFGPRGRSGASGERATTEGAQGGPGSAAPGADPGSGAQIAGQQQAFRPAPGAASSEKRRPGEPMPVITPWGGPVDHGPVGPYSSGEASSYGQGGYRPDTSHAGAAAQTATATTVVQAVPRRRVLGGQLWLIATGIAVVTYTLARVLLGAVEATDLALQVVPLAASVVAVGLLLLVVGLAGYRSSGVAPIVAIGAALALASSSAVASFGPGAYMGEVTWVPTTADELQSDYQVGMGDGTLDLRRLSSDDLGGRTVSAKVGMGSMTVIAPSDVTVTVDGRARMGDVRVVDLDGTRGGVSGVGQSGTTTIGSGPVLTVKADVGMGDLQVERQNR